MDPLPADTTESYFRRPKYLSPTSYALWRADRTQYYLQYLSPHKPPRPPQNNHMSVGSAFDAYAKSYLHKLLVGDNDPKFEFNTLFEAQVEPHNRDEARRAGHDCYQAYVQSGALSELQQTLQKGIGKPRFEFTIEGVVSGTRPSKDIRILGVPLSGKPDLWFTTQCAQNIIFDWKVNGYYSASGVSPVAGYVRLYPGFEAHKSVIIEKIGTVRTSKNMPLNQTKQEWADQLCIYSWVLGAPVGSEVIGIIHQLVCRKTGIRIAEHCSRLDAEYQHELFHGLSVAWNRIQEGVIFDNMTAAESLDYAKSLDKMYYNPNTNAIPIEELDSISKLPMWASK